MRLSVTGSSGQYSINGRGSKRGMGRRNAFLGIVIAVPVGLLLWGIILTVVWHLFR